MHGAYSLRIMFHVEHFDSVSSTNDVVKAAIADGASEGFVACAKRQSGGYGRQGRVWESPEGGMYMSVLLRPRVRTEQLPTLSLAVGVALRRALSAVILGCAGNEAAAAQVLLKWPNDVVFGEEVPFRKLCGISLEQIGGAVCVGIGVNVFVPEIESRNTPAYLAQICTLGAVAESDSPVASGMVPLSVEYVRESILRELEPVYAQWLSSGFSTLQEEYERVSALQGLFVKIEARDGSLLCEGEVLGIDEAGQLMLMNREGKIVRAASGEAHIKQVEHQQGR